MHSKNFFSIIFFSFIIILFSACSQKTTIKAIKASKVIDKSIKNIAVAPFNNDKIGQATQIDSQLSNVKIDNKSYFNVIDRKNLELIMKEKELNDSGLVNLVVDNTNEGLDQIETLITGVVLDNSLSKSYFTKQEVDYNNCKEYSYDKGKKYCAKFKVYDISCQINKYSVKTKVKLTKVAKGSTTFSKTYEKSKNIEHCEHDINTLDNKSLINSQLANDIAKALMLDISPSYIYYKVTILDEVDIKLNKKDEDRFEMALKLIYNKRINKAQEVLKQLNIKTAHSSYVLLYNYALTKEALGNLYEAKELYEKAEDKALSSKGFVKEISNAINRLRNSINEFEKYQQQI
jgi:hypothetical protein